MGKIKVITYTLLVFFIISLTLSFVQAKKVALIVKNSTSLCKYHEKKINDTLTFIGFDVTPIDRDSVVDYSQFDLIVVAGRPGNVYSYEQLDSFVANLPVNDIPTIAIDSSYPDDWNWISPVGISTLSSTDVQKVKVINNSTSITNGYKLGQIIEVHTVAGKNIIDLTGEKYRLTPIASVITDDDKVVIASAESNTELYNNQKNKCRIVFFGLTYPYYWTDDAINLFKNSIYWVLLDTDDDGLINCKDNCPAISNPDQRDTDSDGIGDVCDNCPFAYNPAQSDIDKDGIGDLCDNDIDGDGIPNGIDNCPLIFNLDQKDKNGNGIGDVCDTLPYQVFLDVDNDRVNETAINANNITADGFEVYQDPNINTKATPIDGDFDGMTDWLIDVRPYMYYDKYWDPDDGILTNVTRTNGDYLIDTNGDGQPDITFSTKYNAFIKKADVDHDSKLEIAIDSNFDGSYDSYNDPDGSSKLLKILDGDGDKRNDFFISIGNESFVYWDPDNGIVTNVTKADVDNDGNFEYLIDINGDGTLDKVYDGNLLYNLPDLTIDSITINPVSPTEGDNVNVNVTVKNAGGFRAINFIVEFNVDGLTKTKSIILTNSDPASIIFTWEDVKAGSYKITVKADSTNVITESNEANNELTKSVSVSSQTTGVSTTVGGTGAVIYKTPIITPTGIAGFYDFPKKVEVDVGDLVEIHGKFNSSLNYDLKNIKFSLVSEGLSQNWYAIDPEDYNVLKKDEETNITISFFIPPDAEIYTYPITLMASADSSFGNKTFSYNFSLMLKEKFEITTTVPTKPESKSPLTGLYLFITGNLPRFLAFIIILIIIVIVWKFGYKSLTTKKKYVYKPKHRIFITRFKCFCMMSIKSLLTKW